MAPISGRYLQCTRCKRPNRSFFKRCLRCRTIVRAYRHKKMEFFKQTVSDRHQNRCAVPGCTFRRSVGLELDHVEPATKGFKMSRCWARFSWKKILEELKKCQQLCPWHHLVKTSSERPIISTNNTAPRRRAEWVNNFKLKNGRCTKCRQTVQLSSELEFHHLDPATKVSDVSHLVSRGRSMDAIKTEIDKCVLLCRTCHRVETHHQQQKVWQNVQS